MRKTSSKAVVGVAEVGTGIRTLELPNSKQDYKALSREIRVVA